MERRYPKILLSCAQNKESYHFCYKVWQIYIAETIFGLRFIFHKFTDFLSKKALVFREEMNYETFMYRKNIEIQVQNFFGENPDKVVHEIYMHRLVRKDSDMRLRRSPFRCLS